MSIRLLQINLHHIKALLLRLNEGGVDLVLVQEPWVVGDKVAGLVKRNTSLCLTLKKVKFEPAY